MNLALIALICPTHNLDNPEYKGLIEIMYSLADSTVRSLLGRGIELSSHDGRLYFKSEKGILSPSDGHLLKVLKPYIIPIVASIDLYESAKISTRERDLLIPLSPVQDAICNYLKIGDKLLSTRNTGFSIHLKGDWTADEIESSIIDLVSANEVLRTKVVELDDCYYQVLGDISEVKIKIIDISRLLQVKQLSKIRDLIYNVSMNKYNLLEEYGAEIRLFCLGQDGYIINFMIDHFYTDLESNQLLIKQFSKIISSSREKKYNVHSTIPQLNYGDYCVWLKRTKKSWELRNQIYWDTFIENNNPTLLPVDMKTIQNSGAIAAKHMMYFNSSECHSVFYLAKTNGVSSFTVVFAAYCCAISEWTSMDELVVPVVDNGRFRSELMDMTGYLATCLYVSVNLRGLRTFSEVIEMANNAITVSQSRRDFGRNLEKMAKIPTDLYFNWMYLPPSDHENYKGRLDSTRTISILPFEHEVAASQVFACSFVTQKGNIFGLINYRADLLRKETVSAFAFRVRSIISDESLL